MEILKINGSEFGNGYGYGYADGSGSGSGSGYGYGSSAGYGDGYGDWSGYGSGYGYWEGSGEGDGYGDGSYGYGERDGSGSGSPYGYGDGDWSGDGYWLAVFKEHFPSVSSEGFLAFWKSSATGTPSNGGRGTIARDGLVEKISGPLEICTCHALHATLEPPKQKGERLWLVALRGDLQFKDDKVGALEREIICELKQA